MRRVFIVVLLALTVIGLPRAGSPATGDTISAAVQKDKQEETVYITETGKKYHRENCRHLAKSKIAIKRKDAIAKGYEACKVCKP